MCTTSSAINAFAALIISLLITSTNGLSCYVTDQDGSIYEETNDSWKYCVILPKSGEKEGSMFGVGPSEETLSYADAAFGQNDKIYKVLSICVYEMYDWPTNPKFVHINAEFQFRCICNYNFCNRQMNFGAYLKGLRKDQQEAPEATVAV